MVRNYTNDKPLQSKGLGIKSGQKPVSVMLPPEIDEIVRSIPNRSDWLRIAILEKLQRDGLLLPETVLIKSKIDKHKQPTLRQLFSSDRELSSRS